MSKASKVLDMCEENLADRYRRLAEACMKLAQTTRDETARTLFLAMARAWTNAASRDPNLVLNTAIDASNHHQLDA
jgi:hypothetical protein